MGKKVKIGIGICVGLLLAVILVVVFAVYTSVKPHCGWRVCRLYAGTFLQDSGPYSAGG